MKAQPHIVVAGVGYSSNLGDGVIRESLTSVLRDASPAATLSYVDLAGREGYEDGQATRVRGLALLNWLPRPVATAAMAVYILVIRHRSWRRQRAVIASADVVVVGGGQLLADVHLNFPIKIYRLTRSAEHLGKPLVFAACGVGVHWSRLGALLLRRALLSSVVQYVSVRDERSAVLLAGHVPALAGRVMTVLDPALIVSRPDGAGLGSLPGSLQIGFGIADPKELAQSGQGLRPVQIQGFQEAMIQAMRIRARAGDDVVCFTTGAVEDTRWLREFAEGAGDAPPALAVPQCPEDLLRLVTDLDVVVALRLHAHVVAYALGVPSIGLAWDEKVGAFFSTTGRASYCLEPGVDAAALVRLIDVAAHHSVDLVQRAQVIRRATRGLHQLAAAVVTAVDGDGVTGEVT